MGQKKLHTQQEKTSVGNTMEGWDNVERIYTRTTDLVVKIGIWERGARLNRPEAQWPWKKLRPRDCHSGENQQRPAQHLELGDRH